MLTGLDPAETGKITAALDSQRRRLPDREQRHRASRSTRARSPQARIALAEKGLPGKGQPGFELFDKQKLGASDFQQKVTYQRALEGQIASTDRADPGRLRRAGPARRCPRTSSSPTSQTPATAAVLLGGGSSLDPAAVRGIATLVASSVKGLKPTNVTITDGSGRSCGRLGRRRRRRPAALRQARPPRRATTPSSRRSLNAMLDPARSAPGKAQVAVNADLNVDDTSTREAQLRQEGHAAEADERERAPARRRRGRGRGATGTACNVPGYAAGAQRRRQLQLQRTARVDQLRRRQDGHAHGGRSGTVNRLNVALMVDRTVPAAQVDAAARRRSPVPPASTSGPRRRAQRQPVAFAQPRGRADQVRAVRRHVSATRSARRLGLALAAVPVLPHPPTCAGVERGAEPDRVAAPARRTRRRSRGFAERLAASLVPAGDRAPADRRRSLARSPSIIAAAVRGSVNEDDKG